MRKLHGATSDFKLVNSGFEQFELNHKKELKNRKHYIYFSAKSWIHALHTIHVGEQYEFEHIKVVTYQRCK